MNLFDFWKMSMNGLTEANQKQTKNIPINYPDAHHYPSILFITGYIF